MNLPVYLYGHPVLRRISQPVEKASEELDTLVDDMFETMYRSEGVGLAAPQIGKNIQLVVIDASPMGENFPECIDRKMVIINPELTILDGEEISRAEGCLSLPGLSENVKRVEHIHLKWFDEKFQAHEEEISGFLARIIQHELDHLSGKLYIDHISPIRKQLNRTKLNNIVSGKTRCDYPAKYAPKK